MPGSAPTLQGDAPRDSVLAAAHALQLALSDSLGAARQHIAALHHDLDSLLAAREAVTHVAAKVDSPLYVLPVGAQQSSWVAFLSHPVFALMWPIATAVLAYWCGQLVERAKENFRQRYEQWQAARLARRYLSFAARLLHSLSTDTNEWLNGTGKPIALGRIRYVQRTLRDFDEIKERMITLENDNLEERLYRWHVLVVFAELEEYADYLALSYPEYSAKYAIDSSILPALKRGSFASTMLADAQTAEGLVNELDVYASKPEPRFGLAFVWSLRKTGRQGGATPTNEQPSAPSVHSA